MPIVEYVEATCSTRIKAFIVDYLILATLSGLTYVIIFTVALKSGLTKYPVNYDIIVLIPVLAFMFRDIFGGRSIGKRMMGITVKELENSSRAVFILRLVVRNIFILLWPVEVIMLLTRNKRLGDKVTKLHVVEIRLN